MILSVVIIIIWVNYTDGINHLLKLTFSYFVWWKSVFTKKYWHLMFEKYPLVSTCH